MISGGGMSLFSGDALFFFDILTARIFFYHCVVAEIFFYTFDIKYFCGRQGQIIFFTSGCRQNIYFIHIRGKEFFFKKNDIAPPDIKWGVPN